MKKTIRLSITVLLCLSFALSLSACGFSQQKEPDPDPEILAKEALQNFNHGNYSAALTKFETLKNRFPFSPHGRLAELKAADCNFYLKNYEEAIDLYKEFEKNHPTNEAMPYVLFQIGVGYYNQIDTIDRDPGNASKAIQSLLRLIKTYPKSPYVSETNELIQNSKSFLAAHELVVANYYVRVGELEQAEGRLNYILINYPEAGAAEQAKDLLASIKEGNPPKRPWYLWIPGMSLFFD